MKTALYTLLAAATVVATPALAQSMTPTEYVMAAGAGDLFEIQSAQAVLETTTNPSIRSFAQEMLTDHQKSTDMVKAAALRAHLQVDPPMLMPAQADMLTQLRAQTGPARDTTYITQQKTAHDQALALQKGYATSGTAVPLKQAAAKIVPVVKMHIKMLTTM